MTTEHRTGVDAAAATARAAARDAIQRGQVVFQHTVDPGDDELAGAALNAITAMGFTLVAMAGRPGQGAAAYAYVFRWAG